MKLGYKGGNSMHLKIDTTISTFLNDVKKCKDTVYYETQEGDILNLSSALSQFVFCIIAAQPQYWKTGIVRCKNEDDYVFLEKYLTKDTPDKTASKQQ